MRVEPAARRELPFGFGRKLHAFPSREGFGVAEGHVNDGVTFEADD